MGSLDLSRAAWRTSSYSGGQGTFTKSSWRKFISAAKSGEYDT